MKTRIHFEVLNLSKMVLNYRKNFVKSCTINFIMQTAVMGTENRSGLRFVFNLRIKIDMMSEVPVGRALPTRGLFRGELGRTNDGFIAPRNDCCVFLRKQPQFSNQGPEVRLVDYKDIASISL